MENYLKISHPEYGDLFYKSEIPGKIQLKHLNDKLSILRVYFPELELINEPKDFWFEDLTEVMLTNFEVNLTSIDDLDGKVFKIVNTWTKDLLVAMLSIHDGEPINNSEIFFQKIAENTFIVKWTGYYGEHPKDHDDIELSMMALVQEKDIITPLCMDDSELETYYSGKR